MQKSSTNNAILVISEGPPPLGDTSSEGGALRAWGLAKGLARHGHKVTLAYRSTFKIGQNAGEVSLPTNIKLATWDYETIDTLLDRHNIVVMRYAMGEAQLIVTRLTKDHILVSDSYIPISVEVSARRSSDEDENINYLRLQMSSAAATRRADYFLYTCTAQKNYYLGYLAGLNKLNPVTYDTLEERLLEVPYGVDPEEKPNAPKTTPKNPTLLWYGAFYSWFNMESLIPALMYLKKNLPGFKLLIAGAKNPYNKDPGLLAHYERTMKALKVLGKSVEYIPWKSFDERFETYHRASAIITYNHEGLENLLAWRTRLMDYVLADRPILTNAGDPLGEDLIHEGVAFRIDEHNLADVFQKVIKDPPTLPLFEATANKYSWIEITKQLSGELEHSSRMPVMEMEYKEHITATLKRSAMRLVKLPAVIHKYYRKHGLQSTIVRVVKGS